MRGILTLISIVISLDIESARASSRAEFDVDYSTFLYSSAGAQHPESSISLGAGVVLESREGLERKLDLGVLALGSDLAHSLTPDLRDAYLASSGFSVGQRRVEWNQADEVWKLGLWSPRFVWDPLRPELRGKTGAFYHLETPGGLESWIQVSPVGIPEHGFPIATNDGKVVAYSPFWTPPATRALYSGQAFPLNYSLKYPDQATEFFLRPNATVMFRYGREAGWVRVGYAYGPVQRTVLSVEPSLKLNGTTGVDATIHPRFPYHHLVSTEAGVALGSARAWGSITREIPVQEDLPSNWYTFPYGPSWIGALGVGLEPARGWKLSSSVVSVTESAAATPKYLASIPWIPRFLFNRAIRFDSNYSFSGDRAEARAGWVHDFEQANEWISFDAVYRLSSVTLGLGADFLVSPSDRGFIGQYVGDDRVSWRVAYAF